MTLKRAKISYTFEFTQRDCDGTFRATVADAMVAASVDVRNGVMDEACGEHEIDLGHRAFGERRLVAVSWSANIEDAEHGTTDNG